jgi:hypothetical protein
VTSSFVVDIENLGSYLCCLNTGVPVTALGAAPLLSSETTHPFVASAFPSFNNKTRREVDIDITRAMINIIPALLLLPRSLLFSQFLLLFYLSMVSLYL